MEKCRTDVLMHVVKFDFNRTMFSRADNPLKGAD